MFNPFVLFSKALLEAYVKAGKLYFVRQVLHDSASANTGNNRKSFLITHYSEAGHAQHHYGAIIQDPYKFLYEWANPEHRKKLAVAAGQPEGYKIYASVFATDWQKRITPEWKQKIKRYADDVIKGTSSVSGVVDFEVYIHYGELYIRFKLRNQEVRVKLAEIENHR